MPGGRICPVNRCERCDRGARCVIARCSRLESQRGPCMRRRIVATVVGVLGLFIATTSDAGPSRYGHSDRVERHMLPSVTTGPLDPAWSPDGRWIAFSMRGDIWKVPAEGGTAVALTHGPAWHVRADRCPAGQAIG